MSRTSSGLRGNNACGRAARAQVEPRTDLPCRRKGTRERNRQRCRKKGPAAARPPPRKRNRPGLFPGIRNATCRCGLQLTGVTQRAFIPPPSPTLAGQTFVTGRPGRLAATDSPALSGQAPKPCGLGVETLRSPRRRPAGVVSFSNWLSDRSRAKCRDRTPQPAIRNMRSRTGIRSGRSWDACNKGHASATAGLHTVTNPVSPCDSKRIQRALPFALAVVGPVVRLDPPADYPRRLVTKP